MDSDYYRVEILHYLNPHLIWVEVLKSSSTVKKDEFVLEQIGVYGILPLDITLDIEDQDFKSNRCAEWLAPPNLLMKKYFNEAAEVWFSLTHIDKRSSIFDNNIHKFGEIIVKRPSGKYKKLSKLLIKSGFAMQDVCLFHQQLGLFNLKTKLDKYQTQDVINLLRRKGKEKEVPRNLWEKSIQKHTSVFHTAQNLESVLTVKNLEIHNKLPKNNADCDDVNDLLQNKLTDLTLCKDIDEASLGRAMRTKEIPLPLPKKISEVSIPFLKRKIEMAKKTERSNLPHNATPLQILFATKRYLLEKGEAKDSHESNEPISLITRSENFDLQSNEHFQKYQNSENEKNDTNEKIIVPEHQPSVKLQKKKVKKSSKSKNRLPEYDAEKEMAVAYGPPGLDQSKLVLKVITKVNESTSPSTEPQICTELAKNFDNPYEDVDSDIEIEINNETASKVCQDNPNFIKQNISCVDINNSSNKLKHHSGYDESSSNGDQPFNSLSSKLLQRKINLHKEKMIKKKAKPFITYESDTTNKDSSSSGEVTKVKKVRKLTVSDDDEDMDDIIKKLNLGDNMINTKEVETPKYKEVSNIKNHVNPFKNLDPNISMFVDKLVSAVLMVHTKMNKRITPCYDIRDVSFSTHIQIVLKNMKVEQPMTIQKVSWFTILRGYSLFMISPPNSGKTMGYVPAVCRLVSDYDSDIVDSTGPTCIIVCATAASVAEVEGLCKMFVGVKEKVISCYTGMNEANIATSLLNGCDLLICTPCVLVRLMQIPDFGVNLCRLTTLVLDDCERLFQVYIYEIKFLLCKVKEMLKSRANKELKVQYILASRVWCDSMESLAKKAPNTVICIGAFHECVLYSRSNTTVDFVKNENKINTVLDFLKEIDIRKKTVILCRSDGDVADLKRVLEDNKYLVFACDSTMSVEDLYNLNVSWADSQEPVMGPILVCRDENLAHLNVTDAHHLIHYSLPKLFSTFCKRFSVLNENYPSIFKTENEVVKIKILIEDTNVEQLPKILHFIKRCTNETPKFLDDISLKILAEKDSIGAKNLVPVCDNLLAYGSCPDFWNCKKRHSILKDFDEPKGWLPKRGVVTFKIIHYHTAVLYSARLLSIFDESSKKFPQTYNTLSLKMGMHYSNDANRRLHGVPNVGDICAVSVKLNFFARCQVVKIINRYENGSPNFVLVKMIDEEIWETTRDIYLYYLPQELRDIITYVVQVRLASIQPKDRDVTFSPLAKEQLRKITDRDSDLYMRGEIAMTVGNCIFVNSLETCQDLSSLNETVVRHNFKQQLLDAHAIQNPEHLPQLDKICQDSGLVVKIERQENNVPKSMFRNYKDKVSWAHLNKDDISLVFLGSSESPSQFFIRLVKFEDCMSVLLKEIEKYVKEENPEPLIDISEGDIVLAKFPEDETYERARIDNIYDDEKVKCFFVDQGDWKDVYIKQLVAIKEKLVTQLPFQAIECRLVGVQPIGAEWTDYSSNWFYDSCFEDGLGNLKQLYVQYFFKEKPECTGGHKYAVTVIDTNGDADVIINKAMLDLYLAKEVDEEVKFINGINISNDVRKPERNINFEGQKENLSFKAVSDDSILTNVTPLSDYEDIGNTPLPFTMGKPIRSMPLVGSDDDMSDISDKWDTNINEDFMTFFKPNSKVTELGENSIKNLPALEDNISLKSSSTESAEKNSCKNLATVKDNILLKSSRIHLGTKNSFKNLPALEDNISLKSSSTESDEENSCKNLAAVKDNKLLKSSRIDLGTEDSFKNLPVVKDSISSKSLSASSRDSDFVLIPSAVSKKKELDSDDLSASDITQSTITTASPTIYESMVKISELRKPKLLWHQNKQTVTIKIQLIGIENYDALIKERSLKFSSVVNGNNYGFDFELYGPIDRNKSRHDNKGMYILVHLVKVLKRNWLTLTRDGCLKKWIVYDVDAIDASSDDDCQSLLEADRKNLANYVRNVREEETDSDDDDYRDDLTFAYKRDSD